MKYSTQFLLCVNILYILESFPYYRYICYFFVKYWSLNIPPKSKAD